VLLLAFKLTLAPGLVVATTLAGRRWGPRVAGWLGGLPVVVGPILLALAIEHGDDFAAHAARGALFGLLSLCAFVLTYAWTARRAAWPGALAAGWLAEALAIAALDRVRLPLGWSVALVLVAFAATEALLPRASELAAPGGPPRWDLWLRAGATAALVLTLTAVAGVLGPQLSGMLAAFPVLASVLATFTHTQDGPAAVAALLRGMVRGLVSFAAFCFLVAILLPAAGAGVAFAVAALAALAVHGLSRLGGVIPRARRDGGAVSDPSG
jgi:hypothetical protein